MRARALAILVVVAILCPEIQSRSCRSTVIQIKIPRSTNVTVNYPNDVKPVQFVPYPYSSPGVNQETTCYRCDGRTCSLCHFNGNEGPNRYRPPSIRTNIVIELNKQKPNALNPSSTNETINEDGEGTVIMIRSNSSAASNSDAIAKGDGTSTSSSSAASTANTDIIATFEDNNPPEDGSSTKDILIDASSNTFANSTAEASSSPNKDQSTNGNTGTNENGETDPSADGTSNTNGNGSDDNNNGSSTMGNVPNSETNTSPKTDVPVLSNGEGYPSVNE